MRVPTLSRDDQASSNFKISFPMKFKGEELDKRKILKRCFLGIALFLLVTFLGVASFSFWYLHIFLQAAGMERGEFVSLLKETASSSPSSFSFLFLGLDQRSGSQTLLTDTIMVGFFRLKPKTKITFISFPRDLWIAPLKTKINALYYYGQKENQKDGTRLLREQIEAITNEKINYSILVDFDIVSEIVDCVGGVEIEVVRAFDDFSYPLDDGSGKTTHLHFDAGWQKMDGKRVLQYVRSRKSSDLCEGTDEARVKRQQQVVNALLKKIVSREVITNPQVVGNLYRIWREKVKTDIPLSLLLKVGILSLRQGYNWQFFSLPSELLVNPPLTKYDGLWVLEPRGGDWEEIGKWVKKTIKEEI